MIAVIAVCLRGAGTMECAWRSARNLSCSTSSFSLALLFALTAHLLFTLRWRVPFHIREFVQRDVDVVVARGQSVVKFLTFVVTFSLVLPN